MKGKNFFSKLLFIISFPFLMIVRGLIYFYKYVISPILPHMCKYTPTCSSYFLESVREYGVFLGSIKGIKRIFRCNPSSKGGFDPVIPNIKGKVKWIL